VWLGGKLSTKSNTEVYLTFHLTVRASHLHGSNYSEYQHFLYQKITDLRSKGWTFSKIAEWLNENGYLTVRGRGFQSAHVHSIVKKKRARDQRLTTNFGLRLVDRILINQV